MESSSSISPLYKLGSFLPIMSYYDYAHVWATLWSRLNKKMKENIQKWANALNENCTRITVVIKDLNGSVMKEHWKFRQLKFLNLDLELRSRVNIESFVELLKFFEELKQKDIETFEKLCQEDENASKFKSHYVPNNYISISRINTVPLKSNSEVVPLLKSLCPKVFDDPVNFLPNWIKILRKDYNSDDEEFWNTSCPAEIEYDLKYNKNYDMLDIQLENTEAHLVLKNDKLIATRLSIQSEVEVTEEDAEVLWGNPTHQQNLEYLHLMAPQDMGKFASKIVESCKDLTHLKEVALKYSFDDLELLFQHHVALKGHNIKLLAVNQSSPFRMECSHEKKLFGLDNPDRELLESEEKSHFEMTIKGHCQIYLGSDWFRLNTPNPIRIAGTECTNDQEYAYLSLDGLLELDTQTNIDKEVFHEASSCGLSSDEYVKVPLACISSVSFVFWGEDFTSEVAPFVELSSTLSTANPPAQCILWVNKDPGEPSSKRIENLHKLRGKKWNDNLLNSISNETTLPLREIMCDFTDIMHHNLANLIYKWTNLHTFNTTFLKINGMPKMNNSTRNQRDKNMISNNGTEETAEQEEGFIATVCNLPNIEYVKIILRRHNVFSVGVSISSALQKNASLRYLHVITLRHCKSPNVVSPANHSPLWYKYGELQW